MNALLLILVALNGACAFVNYRDGRHTPAALNAATAVLLLASLVTR